MFLNQMFILNSPILLFQYFVVGVLFLCGFAIVVSILINFVNVQNRENVEREKKSIVETGSMFGFFFLFYLILRFRIGVFEIQNFYLQIIIVLIGLFVVVFGTVVNIMGRLNLGKNWANQIDIYKNQTLVSNGIYSFVRHPLYASLIWIFFASSLIYSNWLAFFANLFVFLPFMYYRAKQEEEMLIKKFGDEYAEYRKKTGMFWPRMW